MSEPGYFHSHLAQEMDCESCGERVGIYDAERCPASACHANMRRYRGLDDRGFLPEPTAEAKVSEQHP
jgi:hypothetical protein